MGIKAFISKWRPKAEAYFSTFPWKNLLFFLLFLMLAFIFWLMLFFQKENVEGTYRMPLKYTNIPDDVVFDNPLPEFIEISVSDNGVGIFMLDIKKRDSLEINIGDLEGISLFDILPRREPATCRAISIASLSAPNWHPAPTYGDITPCASRWLPPS